MCPEACTHVRESIQGGDVTDLEGLQGGTAEAPGRQSRVSVAGEGIGKAQKMPIDSRVGADNCMQGQWRHKVDCGTLASVAGRPRANGNGEGSVKSAGC